MKKKIPIIRRTKRITHHNGRKGTTISSNIKRSLRNIRRRKVSVEGTKFKTTSQLGGLTLTGAWLP